MEVKHSKTVEEVRHLTECYEAKSATDVFLFSNLPSVQFAVSKLLEVQSDKGLLDPCRGYVQPCSVNSSMSSRCQLLCSQVFEDLEDLG